MRRTALVVCLVGFSITATAQPARPRARDLGVPFGGTAGPLNAITDVAGVEVGLVTLIDHIKAGRSQTPLNGGHVGPMELGAFGQRLLGSFRACRSSRILRPNAARRSSTGDMVDAWHSTEHKQLCYVHFTSDSADCGHAGQPVGRAPRVPLHAADISDCDGDGG